MKKNISVISMDSVLQEWLLQKLIKEPPESDSAKELLSGIYDMVSGEINSLLLSTANNSEIASALGVSPASLRVTKHRIRKKTGAKEEDFPFNLVQIQD